MALISRLSRLFRADFHAILDTLEEPDVLLRHAVREMQDILDHKQAQLQKLQMNYRQNRKQIAELDAAVNSLGEELGFCLDAGKEDLARSLVRRKLESSALRRTLNNAGDELQENIHSLQKELQEKQNQLASMQQKADLLAPVKQPASAEHSLHPETIAITEEEVEIAYLQEKQIREAS